LYAVAFADKLRGFAVGEKGIILRTDDGGLTWKDQESSVKTNLFAISVASRDDILIAGDQGRVLASRDGGLTWETQPTITSSPLFAVAYRGGANAWVAGRGGAILRRSESLATVRISAPKIPPGLRGAPKLKGQENSQQLNLDDGDIPKAVPPVRKPQKP
jgi:photosystem II stability/assembly factor-like uncharacterized protein